MVKQVTTLLDNLLDESGLNKIRHMRKRTDALYNINLNLKSRSKTSAN